MKFKEWQAIFSDVWTEREIRKAEMAWDAATKFKQEEIEELKDKNTDLQNALNAKIAIGGVDDVRDYFNEGGE